MVIRYLFILVAGLLFGVGLAFSGMLDPQKIHGFLNVTGSWDPSLVFVMAGGMIVNFIGYHLYNKVHMPVFSAQKHLPKARSIDALLIIGSGVFGIGWAITGLCPGPIVASLGIVPNTVLPLLSLLLLGLAVGGLVKKSLQKS